MRFTLRLLVDEYPACFHFLSDTLGLECTFGGVGDGYASFRAGRGSFAVFRPGGLDEVVELRAAGDASVSVLEVDDVQVEAERLGDAVLGEPVSKAVWGGRVAYVREPVPSRG